LSRDQISPRRGGSARGESVTASPPRSTTRIWCRAPGLAPVLQLAERAGLQGLVSEHVELSKPAGVNAHLKVPPLVAGMIAGADSIEDMTLLRHGAMRRLFEGTRAPSTLGSFLRSFTFGHVRQLDAVASRLLINLAGHAPLLPGAAGGARCGCLWTGFPAGGQGGCGRWLSVTCAVRR